MAKILLVEDNENNIYLVSYLLESRGHTLFIARTGDDALPLAASSGYDLVLMDIQLPDVDGLEVTRRLRKLPSFASVPIVAVTSFAMPGDRQAALEAGCTGYIEKPINPATFVAQVEAFLPPRLSGTL